MGNCNTNPAPGNKRIFKRTNVYGFTKVLVHGDLAAVQNYFAQYQIAVNTVGVILKVNNTTFFDVPILPATVLLGHNHIVKFLLNIEGIDPNLRYGPSESTALIYAVINKNISIINSLNKNPSIDPNVRDTAKRSAIDYAMEQKDLKTIQALLAAPTIDLNGFCVYVIGDSSAYLTPLMYAAYIKRKDIVEELLSYNANTDVISEKGYSALNIAAQFGNATIIKNILVARELRGMQNSIDDSYILDAVLLACPLAIDALIKMKVLSDLKQVTEIVFSKAQFCFNDKISLVCLRKVKFDINLYKETVLRVLVDAYENQRINCFAEIIDTQFDGDPQRAKDFCQDNAELMGYIDLIATTRRNTIVANSLPAFSKSKRKTVRFDEPIQDHTKRPPIKAYFGRYID